MPNYNHFEKVPGFKPNKSFFDLSHTVIQTGEMGIAMPVQCDEVLPGDVWNSGNTAVVRLQPMIAPLLDSLEVRFETFFVPYRLLWSKWEYFLTGTGPGQQPGQYEAPIPTVDKLLCADANDGDFGFLHTGIGSLWDYFHFPILSAPTAQEADDKQTSMFERLKNNDRLPLAFPWLAYTKIWNDWYRDEDLQEEIEIEDVQGQLRAFSKPFKRAWQKDYFTSARPWQQKGITPALPVTGYIDMSAVTQLPGYEINTNSFAGLQYMKGPRLDIDVRSGLNLSGAFSNDDVTGYITRFWDNVPTTNTTFDVSDLRLAFQIQKFMELNSRSGSRYTEFLRAQFGSYPRDDRLDRAELIGTASQPVITSEILQTSATDSTSPQGNMAGHGISVGKNHLTKYHVLESGLIMTLMTVMPKPNYSQGIDRQWLRRSRYDFYFPLFANLSEQGIENVELYADHDKPTQVFGFAGRWDEYRSKQNCLAGQMRTVDGSNVLFHGDGFTVPSLSYWHMSRFFKSKPALNSDFIECTPRKDVFAVQTEPPLIISVTNAITAWRPLPAWSNPGLIDHM